MSCIPRSWRDGGEMIDELLVLAVAATQLPAELHRAPPSSM
jgi:hypothetical protein